MVGRGDDFFVVQDWFVVDVVVTLSSMATSTASSGIEGGRTLDEYVVAMELATDKTLHIIDCSSRVCCRLVLCGVSDADV